MTTSFQWALSQPLKPLHFPNLLSCSPILLPPLLSLPVTNTTLSYDDFVSYFTKKIEATGKELSYPLVTRFAYNLMMVAFCQIHFFSSAEWSRPTWWVYFYSSSFLKANFKASAKYSEIGIRNVKGFSD